MQMPEFAQPLWLVGMAPLLLLLAWSLRKGGRGRLRHCLAHTLRALALGALMVALAGPLARSGSRHADVMFALDVSSSIARESVAEALDFVNRARQSPARVGLVAFGADAMVESGLQSRGEPVREISAQVKRAGTDVGRAIEAAIGAFPAAAQRRIVLLSDGRETLGDARAAAAVARSLGVAIDTVALSRPVSGTEIQLAAMTVPPAVHVREPFTVQATVRSNAAARARLSILRNGALQHDVAVELAPGTNTYSFIEQPDRSGLHEYEAVINSDSDSEPANNRHQAFVRVAGAPQVLHVADAAGDARYLSAALTAQGLRVREVSAAALPATLHELAGYDLVILHNVPAADLSLARMERLEAYVRNGGGGVVSIGGDKNYSAGGYDGTPVERLLPVTAKVKTDVKIPHLSVAFVLDRSGSMAAKSQGEDKLAIAKRAALSSIDLLNARDRVSVLAFDSEHQWVVPPTAAGTRQSIVEQLRELTVGGGTDLYRALEEAHRVMRAEPPGAKHLIVLSDGLTEGARDFEALGARIAADGITISTVSLGADADRPLMAKLAQLGKGRFYHTDDPRNVPRIFAGETRAIARDAVVEGDVRPRRAYAAEWLEGFAENAFPPLGGYQRAFAKPGAQVLLLGRDDDPLLVSWRYGLGRAVAFTADLGGRWGRQWVQWPEFGRFVSQMARWTMRHGGSESLVPRFQWHGQRAEMSVDVLDRDDGFVNGLALEATVTDAAQGISRLRLEQMAPGRYRGEFAVPQAGRYYVTLLGRDGALQVGPRTFGLAVPYSPEYSNLGVDRTLLRDIADISGGRVLPLSAASLRRLSEPPAGAYGPQARMWWPFFLAALLLLLAEVAVRRVALPEAWLSRWRRTRPDDAAAEPGYDALQDAITRERARHLAALRAEGVYLDADDPAARARLYSAGQQRSPRI